MQEQVETREMPCFPPRAELLLRASRHPLAALMRDALDACGVATDETLLLLISGGGDSMAMLLLAAAVRERTDPTLASLASLTIDYGLRAEARAECERAVSFARHLRLTRVESLCVELPTQGNTLENARDARLAAACASCVRLDCTRVVLAHQADDRAESVLLALSRGVAIESLARLLPARQFVDDVGGGHVELLRPLLNARRRQLREFLAELGVAWCDDPSNARRTRGALRSNPATAQLIESIAASTGELCEDAAALLSLRDSIIDEVLREDATSITRERMDQQHIAVRGALLVQLVRACGGEIARVAVHEALTHLANGLRTPKSFACSRGVTLEIDVRSIRAVKRVK